MNLQLLNPELQEFIAAHVGQNLAELALSKNPFPETEWREIVNQIAAKAKAKDKLPTWFNARNILYPEKLSIEQSSSEIAAAYKSQIVSGKTLIDLTGGFGVDDYYFAKKVGRVVHCEINPALSEIVAHNFRQLGSSVDVIAGDSHETLTRFEKKFDWIYIDPSRRSEAKGKVFMLKDCLPNVPRNLDLYFKHADNILIKTAPLLDISAGLSELEYVREIHCVAVKNEVKELLWVLQKGYVGEIVMHAVDLPETSRPFKFILGNDYETGYELPATYLYEPNAAIMKSGGFDAVGSIFKLGKLHRHSHLYTSVERAENFPGRTFKIDKAVPYSKAGMGELTLKKANVTTRNFPDSVELIRKKWKIADGGDAFCFFTTDRNNDKIVLLCTKI